MNLRRRAYRVYTGRPAIFACTLLLSATCLTQAASHEAKNQNARGVALQQRGRLEESLAYFRAAVELSPNYSDAAYNLGLALLTLNRPTETLQVLDKYAFDSADHQALRGAALNALGRSDDAIGPLRRAYELAPRNSDYAYDLVLVLLKADKPGEAAGVLSKARRLFPGSAKIHGASGMLAYLKGENVRAVQEYEIATKLEPGAADLWTALGDVYAATDDFAKADLAYTRSVKLDPATAEYRVKAGRNLLKLHRTAEAEAAFQKAIELDSSNAEAHFQLGKLAAARGDDRSAIAHYERTTALQPSIPAAWYQLSQSYRRVGQEQKSREALEEFRKAK